jgi:hypothetical protein
MATSPVTAFNLKRACGDCQFRADRVPFLMQERAHHVADALNVDAFFHCHKALEVDAEGTLEATAGSKHCAVAMIVLEH